ncbi:hypothetical protein CDD80_1213 [Ophiocordyceps camponoti-rufipedis]|uniref:Hydrophobin n=1 Tax=Ophiocordyceps camponoti-rufipedis TaxID=2004952 RepID=A0A2C5Y4D8_9HYPO|nr:hypothetical protein CDD80_1213 [Ophiocordyceps camponoti-rufipedis]
MSSYNLVKSRTTINIKFLALTLLLVGALAKRTNLHYGGISGGGGNNGGGDNGGGGGNNGGGGSNTGGGGGGGSSGSGGGGGYSCSPSLYSNVACCATDVPGLDLDCQPPRSHTSLADFNAVCAGIGKRARCCVLPVLG